MRRAPALLALSLLLAGCGGASAPTLLVEIVTAQADGAPPADGFGLRGEDGREHALVPNGTRGETGPVYAASAPAGRYALAGRSPWGPMSGPTPVAFAPGTAPVRIAAGRERTLYLIPPEQRKVEEALLRVPAGAGEPERTLAVDARVGADGWMAVRFPDPADWTGTVRVAARLDRGAFAEPTRVALPKDATPWGHALSAAPTVPLEVLLLGRRVEVGSSVRASATDDGLTASLEAPVTEGGRVRFERFPLARDGVRIALSTGSSSDPETWALEGPDLRRGDVRLWVSPDVGPGPGASARVGLSTPPDAPRLRGHLQVRRAGDPSYGIASDVATLERLPPGTYRLLWTAPGWASAAEVVLEHGAAESRVELPVRAACSVRTTLEGALPTGRRYALVARRIEGGDAVLANGFVVRELARAEHEMALPPGRYRFTAEVAGREGPAVEVTLAQPGARAAVRLEPPK